MDQNGCFIYFTYFYDDDGTLRVEVQKEPGMFHIPPPPPLIIIYYEVISVDMLIYIDLLFILIHSQIQFEWVC